MYDPDHPDVVMSAQKIADSTPDDDLAIAIVAATVITLAATALLPPGLRMSRRPRRSHAGPSGT